MQTGVHFRGFLVPKSPILGPGAHLHPPNATSAESGANMATKIQKKCPKCSHEGPQTAHNVTTLTSNKKLMLAEKIKNKAYPILNVE